MSNFEDLLSPGSTELPDCRCGAEMHLSGVKPSGDTEIRIFMCNACQAEFRLTVWKSSKLEDLKAPSCAASNC